MARLEGRSVARKIIEAHLASGEWSPGEEIQLRIDQTLVNDGTGPTALAAFESLGMDSVATEASVIYVDHNLLQVDYKSADDHTYLRSTAQRYGLWYSPAGNGIAHPVHYEAFARPGRTLLGADSHTVAAGGLGMLAIGAGGLDITLAMAGDAYRMPTPDVWGVELIGKLPPWVSAKDVILEMLRRHGVSGGVGRIIEYYGEGVAGLSVWDRHVIANMGAEMGATTSLFPSDAVTLMYLAGLGREEEHLHLAPDPDAYYDHRDRIDLSQLEPLVAVPHSPGNVKAVRELAGTPIAQAYVGSSANPGYRDFAVAAAVLEGRRAADGVSLDINPSTSRILAQLAASGYLLSLVQSGARIHQAGCNGCVGLGQAPASNVSSIRTTPRNYRGRSGTADDHVFLASPETVAASALTGVITDPRTLGTPSELRSPGIVAAPSRLTPPKVDKTVQIVRGPNLKPLPRFDPLPDRLVLPVLLKLGDNITTDDIMPSSQNELPWRSDIDRFSDFVFARRDATYKQRARALWDGEMDGHCIVAGANYGQGSSREHAALSPRYLGLRVIIAQSYARIHLANLANFGVLALRFLDPEDRQRIAQGHVLAIEGLQAALSSGQERLTVENRTTGAHFEATHQFTPHQAGLVLGGGVLEVLRGRWA